MEQPLAGKKAGGRRFCETLDCEGHTLRPRDCVASVNWRRLALPKTRNQLSAEEVAALFAALFSAFCCFISAIFAFFAFWRIFFSPGSQRWQNRHDTPCLQPSGWNTKAHGLHMLLPCLRDPMVGASMEPTTRGADNKSSSRSFVGPPASGPRPPQASDSEESLLGVTGISSQSQHTTSEAAVLMEFPCTLR